MSIESLMVELAHALPERSSRGQTLRQVCLTLYEDGSWCALAGGHAAVHIGEWGGDFSADGATAEEAIRACIQSASRRR